MRRILGMLVAVHAPPLWVWIAGIVGLTSAIIAYGATSVR